MPRENPGDRMNRSSIRHPSDDPRQGSFNRSMRQRSSNTMIPLPCSTKLFATKITTVNPKTVKTKKNRLRLIMEKKEALDGVEKEDQYDDRSYNDRFNATSTILRYSKFARDNYRTRDCKEDVEVVASKKTWGLFPEENTERGVVIGGAVRVGERGGGGGGGLVGEAHHSYERFEVEECVGSSSGLGTSSSSSSSSSNNLIQSNNSSVSRSSRYNNPVSVRRPIRILEGDSSTALVYPVVVAAHEPETSCSSRRPAALAVPAVPVVVAPTTIITTTNTTIVNNTAATTATSAAAAVRSSAAANNLLTDATNTDLRQSNYLLSSAGCFIKDTKKEDAMEPEIKEEDERRSSTSSPEFYVRRNKCYNEDASSEEENKPGSSLQCHGGLPSSYSGTWPIRRDLWANQQMGFSNQQSTSSMSTHNDMASVMSFSSNSGTMLGNSTEMQGHRRLGAKVDVVYNLLSMLGSSEGREDMSSTLLSMSTSIDSCLVMRQSGCLPLLVQLIHAPGQDPETRERASRALHNVVHAKSDERAGRREARVLRFLEQLRDYCQSLRTLLESGQPADLDKHPGPTIAALMKLSFDEAHRHAMCQLGGLHAVAELIEMDHLAHGSECDDQNCITLRRYAGMALTNLTFGDGNNKALLCSFREFMKALVSQLRSPSDDLRQVTASVLRNLSWRADSSSKQTLREVGAVTGLMKAAMEGRKESTLKSILSALWNLSAHCSTNKVDICAVDGALAFLVDMLSYNAPSKTLAIVENAGGILRNVSCHVAVREDYRAIVRERGCLQVLLQQLRSPSLTVVSNACGALWNLSARCPQDQRLLWSLGAVPMLRSLVHSKHKMISMGSSAALKNLLSAKPGCSNFVQLDSTARGLGLSTLPSLAARRQRALEQEIDQNLAETCDNIEPSTSPTNKEDKFTFKADHSFLAVNTRGLRSYQLYNQSSTSGGSKCNGVSRSESRESMRSVTSTHSDTMFERIHRHVMNGMSPTEAQGKQSLSLHAATGFDNGIQLDNSKTTSSEKKYTLRYKNAIPENLRPTDIGFGNGTELRSTTSTISWSSVPDQEAVCSQTLLHSSVEDNALLLNQSMSSTSKFTSQSSVSENTEVTVCPNSEYRSDIPKSKSEISSQLSYVPDNFSTKQCEDYDRMYSDTSLLHQRDPLNSIQNVISPTLSHNSEESLFRNYAETDLDQPTDYSIRYAEQTIEDDEKQHAVYFVTTEQGLIASSLPNEVSSQEDDTVKMYCTEGTPRGISLNSSRAASSSDLQEDSKMKSLSRKLLEPNKLHDTEQNDKASSLLDVEKINRFTTGQDDKKQDFNSTKEFVEKTTWQESSSSVSSSRQYNQDNSTKMNSSDIKIDKHEIITNQSIAFDSESRTSKELFLNKGTSYVGNLDQASDVDEDDEDLLAACINIGMQNNRHRHSFIGNSFEKLPRAESNLMRYQTSIALDQVESNDSIGSATDSFNLIQPETAGKALPINNLREHSSSVLLNIIQSSKNEFLTTKEDQTKSKELSKEKTMLSQNMQKDSLNGNISVTSVTDHNNFSAHTASSTIDVTLSSSSKKTITSNINYSVQEKSEPSSETSNDVCINKELQILKKDESFTEREIVENVNETRMKSTDSESSNSIDSVEQSEHALLELCIQSGLPNAAENIKGKHISMINQQKKLLNDESYAHLKNSLKDENSIESIKDDIDGKETYVVDKTIKRVEEDVYRRQRDPDAMIASLDRLTATLVQQTEAIRERDSSNTMKQSILSDTWNEDSPNEMSFPSISISAPMIPSFKSDVPDGQTTTMSDIAEGEDDEHVNMTDSKIIQQEAIKLAEAVDAEVNKQNEMETTSMTSIDLDAIKPPSSMGSLLSLTASYAGPTDNTESYVNRDRCYSTSLPPVQTKNQSATDTRNCRKKSLPLGVVAKRALNQGQSHTGSLENLLNDCVHSHLENVKPPSVMDELLDVGDMENSMLSVASITSEVADNKDHDSHSLSGSDPVFDLLKPVANVLSITCMRYAEGMQSSGNNSLSEYLENINPPSLFNEVSEMDQSTMEGNTDTLCNDTLCIDAELRTEEVPPTLVEAIDEGENDTDEGVTTISSEYCVSSSAESTPKKRSNKSHLTPKQKRNLAKERYKTYTIAAEFVKKEEERRKQEGKPGETPNKIIQGKCSPISKLTPKQRRQEDRARFQTQVLENPFPSINALASNKEEIEQSCQQKDPEVDDPASASKSSIPTLTKLPMPKALRKKRAENQENKERYRTRTLNDSECLQKTDDCDLEATVNALEKENTDNVHNVALEEINNMLEHNATIVLNTLNESSKNHAISLGDDVLLDQETLSLVSNESGSEQSLRLCFVNGVSKKLMDTYTHQAQDISQRFNHNVQEEKDKSDVEHVQEEIDPVESGSDNGSNCTEEQCQVMKRPRIIKPGMSSSRDVSADSNNTDKSEPGSPKAIRGRRKALYSNPITRKPTPQSSPLKHPTPISAIPIGRSNTSPIVRTTRATTLRQSNGSGVTAATKEPLKTNTSPKISSAIANYENKIKNINAGSKRTSVPSKGSSLTFTRPNKRHSTPPACSSNSQNECKVEVPPTKPLERQGTFTKDEPEVENAPTVFSPASPVKTKIAKPIKGTSKIHPAVGKSKISVRAHQTYQTKGVKANGIEKTQVSKVMPTLGIPKSGAKLTGTGKGLTSNQSALQNDSGKVYRKVGPLGQRSNSNSSIISDTSNGVQSRRLAKEATSKIASLWKKVEENKTKQFSDKSDARKWITPVSGATEVVDGQIISSKPPAFRLFRSSTFEGVPQDDSHKLSIQKSRSKQPSITNVQANGIKYRNSCDLSGMNASEAPCKIPVKSSNPTTSKKEIVQGDNTVVLRRQQGNDAGNEIDSVKRMSRLGSFITVDPPNSDAAQIPVVSMGNGRTPPASAVVPPFNYNPKPADIPSHIVKARSDDDGEGKFEVTESQTEIVTASSRVTTV
ncbi:uncharacterized protein LOC122518035 isoform X2 [Polistes fuscatus]|uniref:uncharacterized protein LOC122518035 isoform X2 n=1 Tax=Polistes fuscatus TaxID=30207 RepID=UPI001CA7F99C|nr:uncharacterized protein LOC122518035 isoform X2 [Polistes fuscatus]XP_043492626.1 uncharacterized protein LOC122518035 isoform X2 [Polistes fuscatus]